MINMETLKAILGDFKEGFINDDNAIEAILHQLNKLDVEVINKHYKNWCKETKRGGAILITSSVSEFFEYLSAHQVNDVKLEVKCKSILFANWCAKHVKDYPANTADDDLYNLFEEQTTTVVK